MITITILNNNYENDKNNDNQLIVLMIIIMIILDVKFASEIKNIHFVFYPYTDVFSTVYSVLSRVL